MNLKNLSKALFLIGLFIIVTEPAYAQFGNTPNNPNSSNGSPIYIDDDRIVAVMQVILGYLEGSFGALVMVIGGIMAIVSAAFGQYKAALGLLIVACGCFILRSVVNTFFGGVLNR